MNREGPRDSFDLRSRTEQRLTIREQLEGEALDERRISARTLQAGRKGEEARRRKIVP